MRMAIKVGVNGFGRIGRYFTRMAVEHENIEVVAVNDLADSQTLAHLFKYDSIHRKFKGSVAATPLGLVVDEKPIQLTAIPDPSAIPWHAAGATVVLESTGMFRTEQAAASHLSEGVKKVVISAPSQEDTIKTIVMGVNESTLDGTERVLSNASCTTNSAAPLIKVMSTLGTIESAYITTVHSYTSDQKLHDAPHNDLRRARAAAASIVPTTTGAAKAITRIFPELEGRVGGCGIRVPVPDGSLTDLTLVMDRQLTAEVVNRAFEVAAQGELNGILGYITDPIVSSDVIGNPLSSVFDAQLTSVVGKMVKVVAWYDNEAGYANRLIDLVEKIGRS